MTKRAGQARMPFFIMGSQRSGTTLLAMLLDAHPDIDVVDEDNPEFHFRRGPTLLLEFDRVRQHCSRCDHLVGFKAPRDTQRVDELLRTFTEAKILWVVRPVEPVVNSMCELHVEEESWAITHAPREITKYVEAFPDDEKLKTAFAAARSEKEKRRQEIWLATLCWVVKERCRAYSQEKYEANMCCFEYGTLVKDVKATTREICSFLDVPWDSRLIAHHEMGRGERIGGSAEERPVDDKSLEKWQSTLSQNDMALIEEIREGLDSD
ncbi:MAG: sulfotransferase family protein [Planctomycetota bacterium]